jgi:carbonic anhydrase
MAEAKDGGIDPDLEDALQGYERFRRQFERDKSFYKGLATRKQKPRLLWIGCSDSRVVPAQITSADPGELFEVRNIANTVPPAGSGDVSVGAAVEYAVNHLGIDDIVVCGHTGCGGVEALLNGEIPGHETHLANWIEHTRIAHRLVGAQGVAAAGRLDAAVRAHVQFQLDNLLTYPMVRERHAAGTLGLHGWLYVMELGELLAYDPASGEWRGLADALGGPNAAPAG